MHGDRGRRGALGEAREGGERRQCRSSVLREGTVSARRARHDHFADFRRHHPRERRRTRPAQSSACAEDARDFLGGGLALPGDRSLIPASLRSGYSFVFLSLFRHTIQTKPAQKPTNSTRNTAVASVLGSTAGSGAWARAEANRKKAVDPARNLFMAGFPKGRSASGQ